ncbi:MAG: preprotein translocase subunit SecG [Chitinophagaceae bacterium]|nr:MAG: preprotein translocase subunit SecG [Bacteroidetes bacterium OLB11]MCC6448671.1 preprotein translocase subunit SecG [Chitinophagaceae bacterium]HMN31836.1 preprotein translocase subunit SecG [Chitinophagaceae bacterium]
MTSIFFILIIIACFVLGFFILIQNPKGGGLSGSFGGLGNQMMGAKQSTDVVEKSTWITAGVMLALVLLSFVTAPRIKSTENQKSRAEMNAGKTAAPPPVQQAPTAPMPETTPPPANQ